MIRPETPNHELARQRDLDEYSILDTLPEKEYDDITKLASLICQTPISLVSLVDEKRQWFKSILGLNASESSREYAFCAHAINDPEHIFEVQDSRLDERFHDNPLVTGAPYVIFYAGVPLVTPQGHALGTLCVIDNKPRKLDQVQREALTALSNQVVTLLELRKNKKTLEGASKMLQLKNDELEQFARRAAHDIKSPLNNIKVLTDMFSLKYRPILDDRALATLQMISTSAVKLKNFVEGILTNSKSEKILLENKEKFLLQELLMDTIKMVDFEEKYKFIYSKIPQTLIANKSALEQIFINLFTNSVKYNNKEHVIIEIGCFDLGQVYKFYVKDNGIGIEEADYQRIFNIFEVIGVNDRFGAQGSGIGLSTVKKMVEGQGGAIEVISEVGIGTIIEFTIVK